MVSNHSKFKQTMDKDDFIKLLEYPSLEYQKPPGENEIGMLYINSRSIKNKMDTLEVIINEMQIKILIVTETWLSEEEQQYFNFKNYNSIFSSRTKRGGGVGIFIHADLEFDVLEKLQTDVNYLAIKLKYPEMIISTIYKPPKYNNAKFFSILEEKMNNINNFNGKCFFWRHEHQYIE